MCDAIIAEEDYPVWNGYLYQLQEEAPRPKVVPCQDSEVFAGRPPYFGAEYHGAISRELADRLCREEGNFLIRESQTERGRYTLVLRILGRVKNFKLFWENGEHFVGEKRFHDIYALVEDGLITMYVEEKAHDYIQNMSKNKSVYCSLSRTKQLLSRHMPDHPQVAMQQHSDPSMSPRRDATRNGGLGSPRHAHNGRNTEDAALPYHLQNPAYVRATDDGMTEALGNKLMATDMLTEARPGHFNNAPQQGRSMIQSLMASRQPPQQFQRGHEPLARSASTLSPGVGGNKKSLTPTSSDERKRTKAKKIATEDNVAQPYEDFEPRFIHQGPAAAHGSPMRGRNGSPMRDVERTRSPSSSSGSTTDSESRPNYARPQVGAHVQNKGHFYQHPNNYINQHVGNVPQYSPVHRNNSDPTQPSGLYHRSMPPQHMQTNIAHVRQLSGGSTSGSSIASSGSIPGSMSSIQSAASARQQEIHPHNAGMGAKMVLDANDNQLFSPNSQRKAQPYHSPTRARQNQRQQGFDSSGSEVIPAKTFHQLKMFQKRLEEASDDDIRKEAQDQVTTLHGQRKLRLTRSNTTACTGLAPRPNSGKVPPRPAPRSDVHCRQRSEPVELFQHPAQRVPSHDDSQVPGVESVYHRQTAALRDDFRQQMARRNKENGAHDQALPSELRAGSEGSCNSSMSNISIGSAQQHQMDPYCKHPDSLSHMSTEDWTGDDRESSPSPQSTSQRSCSSDDNSVSFTGPRAPNGAPQRHTAVSSSSADALWQQRHAEERNARAKAPQATPFSSSFNGVLPSHNEADDVMTDLPSATRSPKNVYRRTQSEAILPGMQGRLSERSTLVPPIVNNAAKPRRKSSDSDIMQKPNHDGVTKPRHHSETSSEEGTPRPVAPATALHKPLERRATTGSDVSNKKELERQLSRTNGYASPVRNSKKAAHRSNSGPSPRKSKKSPDGAMSPRMHHSNHQRSTSSPRNENVPYYDKEHVFKSHTYRGLQWCEYCGNFMWGIIQQGMQCRDCGLNVHKQCSKLVPGDCQPALKHVKNVFGIDLTALVKLHGTERPIVVDKCIEEIEQRGMESEGIYRVPGLHEDLQELRLVFDRYGSDVNLAVYEDINIVACGLKLYLRELPVPLFPYNLYSRFINAEKLSNADGKIEALRTALDMMPPAHLQTIKHIIQHLGRVCDHAGNQMNAQNLGIVFGPTMLRPPEKDATQARYNLNDAQYQKNIVQTIIENRTQLFRQEGIRETHNL